METPPVRQEPGGIVPRDVGAATSPVYWNVHRACILWKSYRQPCCRSEDVRSRAGVRPARTTPGDVAAPVFRLSDRLFPVTDVTRMLQSIELGEPRAAEQLLPLVYDELRRLAQARMAHERPGQTLQATALVHEAYLRLVGDEASPGWENRRHFFAAAAEAMRRILIEAARRRERLRHGGGRERVELAEEALAMEEPPADLLALDDALRELELEDPRKAELVKLRYFAGLNEEEAAAALGVSRPTASRWWTFSRAWLFARIHAD